MARPSGDPGGLEVLDWAGFKAAVSYTFDDANSSQISHYPELGALGVPMTFYLQTGKAEARSEVWAQAVRDGHELGNHTRSHRQTASEADIDAATEFIQETFGVRVWTMAAPYGDPSYVPLARSRFLINRGVSNGLIGPNDSTDPFNLFCYIPPEGAAASVLDQQVEAARRAGKWRVILIHGFVGGSDGAYQPIELEQFQASVLTTKALGDVWIGTVVDVGAYWLGQKAFLATPPVISGSEWTYSWSLPEHFPPGKCLRVRVTGGTLRQGDRVLEWDDHGYYEVPLDPGVLTLSP